MIRIKVMAIILFLSLIIPVFASEQSETQFRSAMSLYEAGKIQKAIEKAKEAISLDSKIPRYYSFLGNIYYYLRNNDEAEKYFIKAIELYPEDGSASNGLGLIYSDKGLRDKAIECFKKGAESVPDYYGAYVNLGKEYILAFQEKGDPKSISLSKEALEKAIKLNDKSYDAYGYLGKVFLLQEEYGKAIEVLEKSIKLNSDPKSRYYDNLGDVYYNLAMAYYNKEMFKEAMKNSQESLKISPDASDAVLILGLSYLYLGNMEEADAQYLMLKKINAKNASILEKEIDKKKN